MINRGEELIERGVIEYYLTEREVSKSTGFAVPTLRNMRHQRRGIPYLKVQGRSVRYRPEDVSLFMEAVRVVPEDRQ
jgi:hypothetical protein